MGRKPVHEVHAESANPTLGLDNLFVGSVESHQLGTSNTTSVAKEPRKEAMAKIPVITKPNHRHHTSVLFKLDSGAMADILPKAVYHTLFPSHHKLGPVKCVMTKYGGGVISNLGTCTLYLRRNHKTYPVDFNVTEDSGPAILSMATCDIMGLLTVNCTVNIGTSHMTKDSVFKEYKDIFSGIGHFPGEPYHIELRPDAEPVINPPRPVSVHLQNAFREELKRMKDLGIISPVTQPTEWVNAFVIFEKGEGKGLRICLDPHDLNKNIKREHYYTRSVDDILPKVAGATHFSVLDARSGYWMVELSEESSLLTFANAIWQVQVQSLAFWCCCQPRCFPEKDG